MFVCLFVCFYIYILNIEICALDGSITQGELHCNMHINNLCPLILTMNYLHPSCTILFNLDQESLEPFLHYTLQFGQRVTYALLALCPSIWTKSHLCPSCTIPFKFDQESLMPFLHYTLQFGPRVTYALLALCLSILQVIMHIDHEPLARETVNHS